MRSRRLSFAAITIHVICQGENLFVLKHKNLTALYLFKRASSISKDKEDIDAKGL
jgi:hypothetical protein